MQVREEDRKFWLKVFAYYGMQEMNYYDLNEVFPEFSAKQYNEESREIEYIIKLVPSKYHPREYGEEYFIGSSENFTFSQKFIDEIVEGQQ